MKTLLADGHRRGGGRKPEAQGGEGLRLGVSGTARPFPSGGCVRGCGNDHSLTQSASRLCATTSPFPYLAEWGSARSVGMTDAFKALTDSTRREILRLLRG